MATTIHAKYPYQIDDHGRTAVSPEADHIREMIEQVLFTSPGERVMRPDFGCGVQQLVFAGNGEQLAAAVQIDVQSALQRWLGDVIQLKHLEVHSQDATLQIDVAYQVVRTGQERLDTFQKEGAA